MAPVAPLARPLLRTPGSRSSRFPRGLKAQRSYPIPPQDPTFTSAKYLSGLRERIDVTYQSSADYAVGCNSTAYAGGPFVFDANPSMIPPATFYTK